MITRMWRLHRYIQGFAAGREGMGDVLLSGVANPRIQLDAQAAGPVEHLLLGDGGGGGGGSAEGWQSVEGAAAAAGRPR